jgi:hypothetical protein
MRSFYTSIQCKLGKLTNSQAAFIITLAGALAYFDGLQNQFLDDDNAQIVTNVPVHSITHIKVFFQGGTFYNGQGMAPLIGVYYRPLQTTVYSLIYTVFGADQFFFHLVQLLLGIGSAILLYQIFRCSVKPILALFLSLVFLLHPLTSQVLFSIAQMQDALFLFFGLLALWLLFRSKSAKSLIVVVVCLFLSLLAKETAVMFIIMALLYLFWYNHKRLYRFMVTITVPIALYVFLRIKAIGVLSNPNNIPIDRTDFIGRLMTAPSILLFYVTKFIFPWKLASAYYWVYPHFSVSRVLLPLIADLSIIALVIYIARTIRKIGTKQQFMMFMYFAVWAVLGLAMLLQLVPLDFTATGAWFYFPMIGVLGMIGATIMAFEKRVKFDGSVSLLLMVVVILGLGFMTAMLGRDWSSPYNLAKHDIATSSNDFEADYQIAIYNFTNGDYFDSKTYAARSVALFPYATNENVLGADYMELGGYPQAQSAFESGLKYLQYCGIYDSMSVMTASYGNPDSNQRFLMSAIQHCPDDSTPWLYLAVLDYGYHDSKGARYSIAQAYKLGGSDESAIASVYDAIINNRPLSLSQ